MFPHTWFIVLIKIVINTKCMYKHVDFSVFDDNFLCITLITKFHVMKSYICIQIRIPFSHEYLFTETQHKPNVALCPIVKHIDNHLQDFSFLLSILSLPCIMIWFTALSNKFDGNFMIHILCHTVYVIIICCAQNIKTKIKKYSKRDQGEIFKEKML